MAHGESETHSHTHTHSLLAEQQSGGSNYSVGQVTGLAVHLSAELCSYSGPLGNDHGLRTRPAQLKGPWTLIIHRGNVKMEIRL